MHAGPLMICKSVLPPGSLPLNFKLDGIEPANDPLWARASAESRKRFWKLAGRVAMEVKQRELDQGLDFAGRKLKPLRTKRKLKYKSGRRLDGDPLMPHRALSRTRRLLRYITHARSITFYWAMDWGRILDYHRRGAMIVRAGKCVGRLPVRNVFGISPKGRQEIARRALALWHAGQEYRQTHFLMDPDGMAIRLPMDPGQKKPPAKPKTVKDHAAMGLNVQKVNVTHRTVNAETGIPGVKTPDVRLIVNWKGWKP